MSSRFCRFGFSDQLPRLHSTGAGNAHARDTFSRFLSKRSDGQRRIENVFMLNLNCVRRHIFQFVLLSVGSHLFAAVKVKL